jgi:serine/threonine protein kinase
MSDREERPEGPPGEDLGATALGDSLPGGSATIAGLRIEGEIARGGMGIVYKAFDPQLRRWVAVKVISPLIADDNEFRRRFIAESRAVAALDSDRIVPIYNAGEEDGQLFQVTRFIAGGDLASALKEEGPFPPEEVVRVISQIADALDTAHRKGAIHRDVKPKNILVDREGPVPRYYLTDFGLAKPLAATSGITATGQILGTVDYMAPELIENGAIDGRVDVYALGCVAVELLTGYPPFHRDSKQAILIAHLHAEPALPDLSGAKSQKRLNQIFLRVLARDPDTRYGTCGEFSEALGDILAPGEIPGLLPRGIGPDRKRVPRSSGSNLRPWLVGVTVLGALILAWSASGLIGNPYWPGRVIQSFTNSPTETEVAEKTKAFAQEHFTGLVASDPDLSCSQLSSRARRSIANVMDARGRFPGLSVTEYCRASIETERVFRNFGANFSSSLPDVLPSSTVTDRFRDLAPSGFRGVRAAYGGWNAPFYDVEFRQPTKYDDVDDPNVIKSDPTKVLAADDKRQVVRFQPADLSPLSTDPRTNVQALEVTTYLWLAKEQDQWLIDAVSFAPNENVLPRTFSAFPIFPDAWPTLQDGPSGELTGILPK